jgi:hypothetical protein
MLLPWNSPAASSYPSKCLHEDIEDRPKRLQNHNAFLNEFEDVVGVMARGCFLNFATTGKAKGCAGFSSSFKCLQNILMSDVEDTANPHPQVSSPPYKGEDLRRARNGDERIKSSGCFGVPIDGRCGSRAPRGRAP